MADFARHVVAAAHGRLDLAMTFGATRNGYFCAGARRDRVVNEFFTAATAGH